jgi:hypothetical protein
MKFTEGSAVGGKKTVEVVDSGWHTGTVKWADEKKDYNKIKVTLDLEDGRRCKFNIGPKHGQMVADAMGFTGNSIDPDKMVGKAMTVRLDQWSPEDSADVYNTLQEVKPSDKGGVSEDDLPF